MMDGSEALTLMFAFGMFMISLISLIVILTKDNSKEKNNHSGIDRAGDNLM